MNRHSDIPWRQLIAEGIAIVASILLAFAIDAWWDDRQDRRDEQVMLASLHDEFAVIKSALEADIERHEQNLASLKTLLQRMNGDRHGDEAAVIEAAFLELLSPRTTDLGSGALEALLGSGRLELIESKPLREKIAGWPGVIYEVWDDQASNAKMVFDTYIPYFVRAGWPAGTAMRGWYPAWDIPERDLADHPDIVNDILQDGRFRTLVELRYGYKLHLTEEFEEAIAAAGAILADIEASRR